jgi:hypothetical protein
LLQSYGCMIRSRDPGGNTLLHSLPAGDEGRDELIVFLLKNGVDPLGVNRHKEMAKCLERIDSISLPTKYERVREVIRARLRESKRDHVVCTTLSTVTNVPSTSRRRRAMSSLDKCAESVECADEKIVAVCLKTSASTERETEFDPIDQGRKGASGEARTALDEAVQVSASGTGQKDPLGPFDCVAV